MQETLNTIEKVRHIE